MTATPIETAERAALCACARRRAQESGVEWPAVVRADLDWDALLQLATVQGVTDLLFAPLASSGLSVPPTILSHLEKRGVEATGLNLNRVTQLVDVLQLLSRHGIRALTFKGPTLAQGIYGHLGRRVSNDIDILVHRTDAARVRPLLLAHGYRLPERHPHAGGSLLYGLVPWTGRDDTLLPSRWWETSVDVHVAFAYWTLGIRLDVTGMFDRAVTVDVAGHAIPTLCPDDLLLVLAIHGMMHGYPTLRLVSDVDAVVDRVNDWPAVIRRADAADMRRVLWVALLMAEHLLGTSLPPDIVARVSRDSAAIEIVRVATARMFDPGAATAGWNHHRWLLRFLDGPRRKLGYHARNVLEMSLLKWPWDEWLGRRDAKPT